jgi:tetratricopeptide (TPR) repeat protein
MSVEDTQDRLDDLVDVHLVEEPKPGRYRLHDLVRAYAATVVAPPGERAAAVAELIDFHLHASVSFARATEQGVANEDLPAEPPRRPELVARAAADPGWPESQRPYQLGLMAAAAEIGEPRRAWQLARASWRFLFVAGYNDDLLAAMNAGLESAVAAGDEQGIAAMRNYLASGYYRTGRYAEAVVHVTDALDYYKRNGNRLGEARMTSNLGGLLLRMGRVREAFDTMQRSNDLYRQLQHLRGLAMQAGERAAHLLLLGRDEEALVAARRALQIAVEVDHPISISIAVLNLARIRLKFGDAEPAGRLLRAVLPLARRINYRVGEAEIIGELGRVAAAQGRYEEAIRRHLTARQMMQEQGDRRGVAQSINDLAVTLRTMGEVGEALDLHRHALSLARALAHPHEEARALTGIADCLEPDDAATARQHLLQALVIYTRMGVSDRFEIGARLGGRRET